MVVMCFFALNVVAQTYSQIYDDDFYKRLYPDIANAYGRSNAYEDLRRAFGNNNQAYYQHFIQYGIYEGRRASELFNPQYYRNAYKDLQNAFGNNWKLYYIHYLQYGKSERRRTR